MRLTLWAVGPEMPWGPGAQGELASPRPIASDQGSCLLFPPLPVLRGLLRGLLRYCRWARAALSVANTATPVTPADCPTATRHPSRPALGSTGAVPPGPRAASHAAGTDTEWPELVHSPLAFRVRKTYCVTSRDWELSFLQGMFTGI